MSDVGAPSTGGGLSLVVELGSRKSADAELSVQLRQDIAGQGPGARIQHFMVPGVTSARGFTVVTAIPGSAANALFTEGRCLLLRATRRSLLVLDQLDGPGQGAGFLGRKEPVER